MKPLGFLGIALAGLGAILLLTRKAEAAPPTVPPEEIPPEVPPVVPPAPPVGPDWAYSDVAGAMNGAFLTLGARITNNTSGVLTRNVSYFVSIPSIPASWDVDIRAVTLGGGETKWVDFSFELWAVPPPGTTVEMWLQDDAGGVSDKVFLTA